MLCGRDHPAASFRLTPEGQFEGPVHDLDLVVRHYGGRARIRVENTAVPLHLALGLRQALKAALARVEAEIEEATGETLED